jgi:hypothetical protein
MRTNDPVTPSELGLKAISSHDPVEAPDKNTGGDGGSELLPPTHPLVAECKALFEKTFAEKCGGQKVTAKVLSAEKTVIDGISVKMSINLCSDHGCHPHRPECTFETSTDHTDAKLLELDGGKPSEETKGLIPTLKLNMPLCDADDKDGSEGDLLETDTATPPAARVSTEDAVDSAGDVKP